MVVLGSILTLEYDKGRDTIVKILSNLNSVLAALPTTLILVNLVTLFCPRFSATGDNAPARCDIGNTIVR